MSEYPMPGHHAMHMPLLPEWLRVVCALVLLGVVGLHVWHSYTREGQHRWWHVAHTVMALGMIGMYLLPVMSEPRVARAGLAVFAVTSIVLFVVAGLLRRREGMINPLWLVTGLDMLAMTYMFLPAAARLSVLTWGLIAYLTGHLAVLLTNLWARYQRYSAGPARPGSSGPTDALGSASVSTLRASVGLGVPTSIGVRLTLAVMVASMAYMLLAMGPGMTTMGETMHGM